MGFTSVYWQPEKYTRSRKFVKPISGHLGIDFDLPKRDPVTAGWYFNQNQSLASGHVTKLSKGYQPEYFLSGDNVLPTVGGNPRLAKHLFKFSR